jgi:hypothetical protein
MAIKVAEKGNLHPLSFRGLIVNLKNVSRFDGGASQLSASTLLHLQNCPRLIDRDLLAHSFSRKAIFTWALGHIFHNSDPTEKISRQGSCHPEDPVVVMERILDLREKNTVVRRSRRSRYIYMSLLYYSKRQGWAKRPLPQVASHTQYKCTALMRCNANCIILIFG